VGKRKKGGHSIWWVNSEAAVGDHPSSASSALPINCGAIGKSDRTAIRYCFVHEPRMKPPYSLSGSILSPPADPGWAD